MGLNAHDFENSRAPAFSAFPQHHERCLLKARTESEDERCVESDVEAEARRDRKAKGALIAPAASNHTTDEIIDLARDSDEAPKGRSSKRTRRASSTKMLSRYAKLELNGTNYKATCTIEKSSFGSLVLLSRLSGSHGIYFRVLVPLKDYLRIFSSRRCPRPFL